MFTFVHVCALYKFTSAHVCSISTSVYMCYICVHNTNVCISIISMFTCAHECALSMLTCAHVCALSMLTCAHMVLYQC